MEPLGWTRFGHCKTDNLLSYVFTVAGQPLQGCEFAQLDALRSLLDRGTGRYFSVTGRQSLQLPNCTRFGHCKTNEPLDYVFTVAVSHYKGYHGRVSVNAEMWNR